MAIFHKTNLENEVRNLVFEVRFALVFLELKGNIVNVTSTHTDKCKTQNTEQLFAPLAFLFYYYLIHFFIITELNNCSF